MIFVCVKSGLYYILKHEHVIGVVRREFDNSRYYKYPKVQYRLTWKDDPDCPEIYSVLADIHERHKFSNYGGYNSVLKRRN